MFRKFIRQSAKAVKTTKTIRALQRAATFENLEPRNLFSGGSVDWDGKSVLEIKGTAGNDTISVECVDVFKANGDFQLEYWAIDMNGKSKQYVTSFIRNIYIDGLGGKDNIDLFGMCTGSHTYITTTGGNDTVTSKQQTGGRINWKATGTGNTLNWRAPDFLGATGQTDFTVKTGAIQNDGLDCITYSGVQNINFIASFRDDTIAVDSVALGTNVSVDGQQGDDRITVGRHNMAANIFGNLTLEGGSEYKTLKGVDTVIFDDVSGPGGVYTLNYSSLNKLGMRAPIKWNAIEYVTLSTSNDNDVINVDTASEKLLTINANAGNDVIRIGGGGIGSLGYVQTATLKMDGGNGNDLLTLNDQFTSGPNGYIINATKIKRGTIPTWTYEHLEQISLLASMGNNYVNAFNATIPLVVRLQNGNDTVLSGHAGDSIYGSGGNDQIWGNDGNDFIDGGIGNDWLQGNGGADSLIGGAGTDSLSGGEGNDWLFAKDGEVDYLDGGSGIVLGQFDANDVFKPIP